MAKAYYRISMLNIVCVNNNNYLGRGEEYVQRLREGVSRYCTVPYRFIEFHGEENGWWAKLELFKEFKERTLYFDLDTVITGNIDFLSDPEGFTALTDFYHPHQIGSGLMSWNGDYSKIYDKWIELKKPELMGGDQQWIYMIMPQTKRFQEKYPNKIVSYKVHCQNGVPEKARVVCFHGKPRPHEVNFQTGELN